MSRPLQRAIHLRRWVRALLPSEDWSALSIVNAKADDAYMALGSFEATAYIAWAIRGETWMLPGASVEEVQDR